MAIRTAARRASGLASKHRTYRYAFIVNAHRLLAAGFARLPPRHLHGQDEPEMTARLVESMEALTNDRRSPAWCKNLHALEEVPVKSAHRAGKKRRRIDIEVHCLRPVPKARFHIEAKILELKDSHSVSAYVGKDGLGLILAGEYARDDDDAGMLGYIESETPEHWIKKLIEKFGVEGDCQLEDGKNLSPIQLTGDLPHCYHSEHQRPALNRAVTVYHTFLVVN